MRPPVWNPPIELSASEQKVAQRIRKAKLFLFLRQIRHELFDREFQQELAKVFKDSSVGLCEAQDIEEEVPGSPKLVKGVAPNRRISIEDRDMRHRRKSRNQRFDGYKRHVLKDLDLGMVRAVGVTSANQPEAEVTPAIETDLQTQKIKLKELQIDRAYLTSHKVYAT